MKTPLRIAILECDTLKYGGYGDVFKALLGAGADALRMPDVVSSKGGLEISKWDVVSEQKYPALEDIDAILISGSRKFHASNFLSSSSILNSALQGILLSKTLHGFSSLLISPRRFLSRIEYVLLALALGIKSSAGQWELKLPGVTPGGKYPSHQWS